MLKNQTLAYLTSDDWQALAEIAIHQSYALGDVIIAEGAPTRNILIIRKGYVQVERSHQGRGVALSQLGTGEVLGEMSWLEQTGASASVIAASEVEVEVLEELALQSLLNSLPGFSARFYQSLAVTLSRRLRVVSDYLSQPNEQEQRSLRIGNISERQIPPGLVAIVEQFKQTMVNLEQQLQRRQLSPSQAQEQTNLTCQQLLNSLRQHSQTEALMDSAWSNLLAFRDLEQLESGIGDYVFRELFALMMSSATIASCYSRPRGIIDSYEVNQRIDANEPEGDGWLGALIDAWFLSSYFCQNRRQIKAQISQFLQYYIEQRYSQNGNSVQVLSLASGSGRELLDVLSRSEKFFATVIDRDLAALRAIRQEAEKLGRGEQMTLIQTDLLLLATGQEKLTLPPQHLLYSFGLCDYLSDEQILQVLGWAHGQLADQGMILLTNISPEHPERLLIMHILEWTPYYRTREELENLLQKAAFMPVNQSIEFDGSAAPDSEICWVVGLKQRSK